MAHNQQLIKEEIGVLDGVTLKIKSVPVIELKKELYGRFAYILENQTHFSIKASVSFAKSKEIEVLYNETKLIPPFTYSTYLHTKESNKLAELHYMMGFKLFCKAKIYLTFPTVDEQHEAITAENIAYGFAQYQEANENLFARCSFENLTLEQINATVGSSAVTRFVHPYIKYDNKKVLTAKSILKKRK